MTRVEVEIGEIVLCDVPPRFAEGLGPLVEQRLMHRVDGSAARPDPLAPLSGPEGLADLIADHVWSQAGLTVTGSPSNGVPPDPGAPR